MINIKIIVDNKKLIAARENPNIENSTFLQLFGSDCKASSRSLLFIISKLFVVQPENSSKKPCSIPKWYPEIEELKIKIKSKLYNQNKFL